MQVLSTKFEFSIKAGIDTAVQVLDRIKSVQVFLCKYLLTLDHIVMFRMSQKCQFCGGPLVQTIY